MLGDGERAVDGGWCMWGDVGCMVDGGWCMWVMSGAWLMVGGGWVVVR